MRGQGNVKDDELCLRNESNDIGVEDDGDRSSAQVNLRGRG